METATMLSEYFEPLEGSKSNHASQSMLVLLFSASWYKPHNDTIQGRLQRLLKKSLRIPCLYLSSDLDQTRFEEHIDGMAWTDILPYKKREQLEQVYKHFKVDELLRVKIVDKELNVLTTEQVLSQLGVNSQDVANDLNALLSPIQFSSSDVSNDADLLHEMRQNANIMYDEGDFQGAASIFSEVLALDPNCNRSNFNMGVILHTMGLTYLAVKYMLRVVESDPNDSTAHSVLRTVFFVIEPSLVLRGYEDIIARHPDHVRAVHSLAALRGDATTSEARYVREVFDELANTFEEKLVQHLHYKVPWQLLDLLKKVFPVESRASDWRVVDLGCGTGLCGRIFKEYVNHIIGVDLSPMMIEKARELGSYDELYADELLPVLTELAEASIDLILSADVWIYVGALELVFQACRRVMKPGPSMKANGSTSYLAFSIEEFIDPTSPDEPHLEYQLVQSGRFQHSRRYIERMANDYGFIIRAEESIVVREESGEPIPGVIFILGAI